MRKLLVVFLAAVFLAAVVPAIASAQQPQFLQVNPQSTNPFSPAVRAGLEFGRGMPGALYLKAQRVRTLLAADFERALAQVDLVVSPTTAIAAPRYCADAFASGELDPGRTEELVHYTFAYNLTGLPAAQVPCGHTGGGLPIGLQIAAPPGGELRALGLAALLERTTGARVPPLYVDLLE